MKTHIDNTIEEILNRVEKSWVSEDEWAVEELKKLIQSESKRYGDERVRCFIHDAHMLGALLEYVAEVVRQGGGELPAMYDRWDLERKLEELYEDNLDAIVSQSKRCVDEGVIEFIKWLNALEEDWLIRNLPNSKERMQIGSIENARRFAQQFLNQNTESKDHSFLGNICRHCGATREQTVIKCVGEYKPTPNTESEEEVIA